MLGRVLAGIALIFGTSIASSAGLNDGETVDRVFLHPTTNQAALILSVDQPLTSEEVEKKLDFKLGSYIGFVSSGELYKRFPKASRDQRVLIAFILEFPPPPAAKERLFRMKDRLIAMGYDVWLKVLDERSQKNIDLAP